MPKNGMYAVADVAAMIKEGKILLLAGEEALLAQLPTGTWIGGTSANFMAAEGGVTSRDKIFVTDISDIAAKAEVRTYDIEGLRSIGKQYPENGYTILIVPGLSDIHATFAKEVQGYGGVFNAPLVGWIAGVHVSEIGQKAPKSFGGSPEAMVNKAAALHVTLPAGKVAHVDTINLFSQSSGDVISFDVEGFGTEGLCKINGQPTNLAAYITEKNIDTKLPLVADYNGAMINVSIQAVDAAAGKVQFYAPVFKGIDYHFAVPVADYIGQFSKALGQDGQGAVAFSCNCILNYLYAELEGKKTGTIEGPITFGEIAYMLLNQTLVYLTIEDA